jgi:hypothetical protein
MQALQGAALKSRDCVVYSVRHSVVKWSKKIFAIFDYFETETVEVGRVRDIKWNTDEHDLKDLKENGKVNSVCWAMQAGINHRAYHDIHDEQNIRLMLFRCTGTTQPVDRWDHLQRSSSYPGQHDRLNSYIYC